MAGNVRLRYHLVLVGDCYSNEAHMSIGSETWFCVSIAITIVAPHLGSHDAVPERSISHRVMFASPRRSCGGLHIQRPIVVRVHERLHHAP